MTEGLETITSGFPVRAADGRLRVDSASVTPWRR